MAATTTVAVPDRLRQRIKMLAATLDVSQGEIVERAVSLLEHDLLHGEPGAPPGNDVENQIKNRWKQARDRVLASDPGFKQLVETLTRDGDTIDDYTIRNWETGLE